MRDRVRVRIGRLQGYASPFHATANIGMMTMKTHQHLFGPVPSRRLGRSLGVDLTPAKTCSFDCIFCQLGRTTCKTMERREYLPVDPVLEELRSWIREDGDADIVTLAGSGEPTLNSRFGDVIDVVHQSSRLPVALLTNGTTLIDPDVRRAAAKADIVKISLSAWDTASMHRVNRPCSGISFENLVEGQRRFRQEFSNRLWLEVFLVEGVNSHPDQVAAIAAIAQTIGADRIQLNTAVRPPAEAYVRALSAEAMTELAAIFSPEAETIAEFSAAHSSAIEATEERLRAMLHRRPCTAQQIADVFGLHPNEVSKYLGKLLRTKAVVTETRNGEIYYTHRNP